MESLVPLTIKLSERGRKMLKEIWEEKVLVLLGVATDALSDGLIDPEVSTALHPVYLKAFKELEYTLEALLGNIGNGDSIWK